MILAPTLTLSAGSGAAIVRPTFSRDFAGEKTLNNGTGPAITFTRASNATFFDASGVLQTASNDAPRFDHDPATAGNPSRGLLIEEARTNSFQRSQEIDNVYWQKNNLTVTANTHTAPDGTMTADSVIENVTTALDHRLDRAMNATSGTTYTLSAFVKLASGTRRPRLFTGVPFGSWTATFDLTTGTVAATTGSPSASITSVGNGWFRISGTKTATSTGLADTRIMFVSESTGSITYDGDGTSGFYVWGMQLEEGAFPTSYIPTTTAAATRSADSAVVTPISGFYNQAEGTLFAEGSARGGSLPSLASLDDNTANERIQLRRNISVSQAQFLVSDGGTAVVNVNTGSWTSDTAAQKLILAYKADDCAASFNGASVVADTSASMPQATQFLIGNGANSNLINGHLRKIAYYPKRLSNALLQQLTT